jgi:hypothetical protein
MPTLEEISNGTGGPLHDALLAGMADISQRQTVCFNTYTKWVLPLDGFVFWIRTGVFEVSGVLHWQTDREQNEDETAGVTQVVFTTDQEIAALNATNTQTLVVGGIEGRQYAFNRHGWFFQPAGIWHYQGDAINPAEASQLIDDRSQIDPAKLIVSNSLPVWLFLVTYTPVWLAPLNPLITLYPSYLVPDNLPPPYGAVHITDTRALQAMPTFDRYTSTHRQLTQERVTVTLYGCNNDMALDFMDLVERYSVDYDVMGIMNMPTVRDDKRPWPPGMLLAQRKTIEFEVSYIQTRVNNIARQLINEARARVIVPDPLDFTIDIRP